MSKKSKKSNASLPAVSQNTLSSTRDTTLHRYLSIIIGWLILLISISFFTGTYDTAHVKLTLLQIGVTLLVSLWASLKLTERKLPVTSKNWLFLIPLLVYVGWQTVGFVCFPYKLEATEEFLRLLMYGSVSLLIACEFSLKDIKTVTKFIIAAAWICFVYGAIQIINIRFPGVDLLPWHGFFGNRVFSTLANPNFFGAFIVGTYAIIGTVFISTRRKSLLVLLTLGLIDLFFTESKGAWLAFGGMLVFYAFTYTNFIAQIKKKLVKINSIALIALLITAGITGIYSLKRSQSISFRAYTWLSTIEMIQDSPLIGTGPGSFKIVYPAYRRPQIFYIENAHNTETAHAENEYLEQAATGGLVGLALFLWLLVFLFTGTFKTLGSLRPTDTGTALDNQQRERRLLLLGYSSALLGLLLHECVDISVHFASGGIFLSVFIGILLALLIDNVPHVQQKPAKVPHPYLLRMAQILTLLFTATAVGYMAVAFYHVLHNMAAATWGEGVLLGLSVLVFAFCLMAGSYIYAKAALTTKRLLACAVLIISLPVCVFFFRLFLANHYYSLGVALTQMQQPFAALGAFSDAIKLNPFLAEYRQYRANVFAMTLDSVKRFSPNLGDTDTPRTDFERAQADFKFVLTHNPNHALLHQNIGQLHYNLAINNLTQAQAQPQQAYLYQQIATENFERARNALIQSLRLDPVNENTYLMLINMALIKNDIVQAQAWLDMYYKGPDSITQPDFLKQHLNNPKMRAVQEHLNRLNAQVR